jgi:hypothetical protein
LRLSGFGDLRVTPDIGLNLGAEFRLLDAGGDGVQHYATDDDFAASLDNMTFFTSG